MLCSSMSRGHLCACPKVLNCFNAELSKCHQHANFPRECAEAGEHVPERLHLAIQDPAQAK